MARLKTSEKMRNTKEKIAEKRIEKKIGKDKSKMMTRS
jgi:hypothetical protein